MTLDSFSRFPELPPEIRLAIWKLAIRPTARGGGLHQFSIMHVNEAVGGILRGYSILPMPPHAAQSPTYMAGVPRFRSTDNDNNGKNESACLWDAGLFTACTESRQVITSHFHCQQWNAAKKAFFDRLGNDSYSEHVKVESLDKDAIPATMTVLGNNEHWQLMVRPYQDLFCLTPLNWGMHIDWDTIFYSLPFSASSSGYGRVRNVAVEFDASWNFNLPKTMDDLLRERTPRGLVARAVREDCDASLWLIDRYARRSTTEQTPTSCPRIFHDCEQEYVETTQTEVRDSEVEYTHTAAFFMDQMESLRNPDNDPRIAFYLAMIGDIWDSMHFGILTCSPHGSQNA